MRTTVSSSTGTRTCSVLCWRRYLSLNAGRGWTQAKLWYSAIFSGGDVRGAGDGGGARASTATEGDAVLRSTKHDQVVCCSFWCLRLVCNQLVFYGCENYKMCIRGFGDIFAQIICLQFLRRGSLMFLIEALSAVSIMCTHVHLEPEAMVVAPLDSGTNRLFTNF